MHALEASDGPLIQPRVLRALHEIAVAIAGVLDQAELARLVTHHARELLGADGSVLHGWDDDADGFLELSASRSDAGLASGVLRMGQGIAGQAALRRSVLIIDDYPSWAHAVLAARYTVSQAPTDQHELVLPAADSAIGRNRTLGGYATCR